MVCHFSLRVKFRKAEKELFVFCFLYICCFDHDSVCLSQCCCVFFCNLLRVAAGLLFDVYVPQIFLGFSSQQGKSIAQQSSHLHRKKIFKPRTRDTEGFIFMFMFRMPARRSRLNKIVDSDPNPVA